MTMNYTKLGHTDIQVSKICLGTMTWGEQNTQQQAFEQMEYALERGVNFWDTAELYPVPPQARTFTQTEKIIGNWFTKTKRRNEVIIATKVAGPAEFVAHIRQGRTRYTDKLIADTVNGSLKRLHTDVIDLYQLHWPERPTNFFGQLGFQVVEQNSDDLTPLAHTLEALSKQVRVGKIRAIGLSNETAWGTMKLLELAKQLGLERIVSIQNPYNLLNRSFEVGLAEVCHQEQAGLLAYSPLGFGVLTGKYLNDARPKDARITLYPRFSRYINPQANAATQAYADLAQQRGISLAQMALSYVNSRPFVTANIIGATTMPQLKENIDSIALSLDEETLLAIEQIHQRYTYPSP